MNTLIRVIKPPRYLLSCKYSSSSDKNMSNETNDFLSDEEIEYEVEEVKIPLPFGHVAAKWWGDKNQKPFLMMHGWQDNAGTFDRLIPLLPKQYSYLAIDLPGHGKSSSVPHGTQYHFVDNLCTINHILKEYEWEKVSLISHSLGSIFNFVFAAVFPKKVDFVVGIDALKPSVFETDKFITRMEDNIENFMLADKRNREQSEPPAYALEDMVEKLVKGTRESVTKECASYLLKRNIKPSAKHPGKFYFARDSRLKFNYGPTFSQEQSIALAKRINMPYLFIKAKNSPYYERKEHHMEVVEVLKNNNPNFVYEIVDATHHVHLTEPEKISGLINDFILKHKKPEDN
ncbi:hypothetical protein PVAND_002196 [Polypedilum vanderplanki]|uniref:AB hydrolase-1 domain-containing protein n=1 Tax=Polypedilum vanderplanki TaxID=319348 RepID=A0A9J6BQL1_POLVA|nr:hypothetical protein PVAND_002196 [Polypedilum vanderplanki]